MVVVKIILPYNDVLTLHRLGFDPTISREPLLCINLSNSRIKHWFFCIFHSVSSVEQRSLCVSHGQIPFSPSIDPEASARWGLPRLTLSTYLQLCSLLCFGVTFWLVFFEKEV